VTLHVHLLRGCAPTPLAHYLKALGILRLVATQADKEARGYWKDGGFFLATTLDEEALVRFFLERYEPTPMLSPWNGGSGFYFQEEKLDEIDPQTGKKRKTGVRNRPTEATRALDALLASSGMRLAQYKTALVFIKEHLAREGFVEAPEAKDGKEAFLSRLRNGAPDGLLPWFAASFVVQDGKDGAKYPALLGSGGNEGNFEYSNNFVQHVISELREKAAPECDDRGSAIRTMLFRGLSNSSETGSAGQFFPGGPGGPNATSGFDDMGTFNPWDFLLMLEGTVVLRVAALRRLDADDLVQAAAPFALRSQASGYASASPEDASPHGEQWVPLWSGPSTLAEVAALFDEGRLHGGHRGARGTLDATRALANLGVARGVESFARFGYFLRNGDKMNLSVPLGILRVQHRPEVRVLDDLDRFVDRLSSASREKGAPLSLPKAARALERAMLAASLPTATHETWAELVCVLGEVEKGFLAHGRSTKDANLRPLPRLSARWLDLIDDRTPEVRLAVAIASQGDAKLGPLRANVIPLSPPYYNAFHTTADSLAKDPSVVWEGRSLVTDLTAVALRRVIDGTKAGAGAFPLIGARSASLEDVQLFLEGRVDDVRIGRLVRGLLSLDWGHVEPAQETTRGEPLPLHALVRLACLPHPVVPLRPRLDATPLRLLSAGRLSDAAELLVQRLAAGGLRAKVRVVAGDAAFARRLAASVAIPLSKYDYVRLLGRLSKPFTLEIST
jgi:CRISPR-associated protein Csx17